MLFHKVNSTIDCGPFIDHIVCIGSSCVPVTVVLVRVNPSG